MIAGGLLFIYDFCIPLWDQYAVIQTAIDILLKLSFYGLLFIAIDALICDEKVKKLMMIFMVIMILSSCYLLMVQITSPAMIVDESFIMGVLLVLKVIFCYWIGYHLYRYNKMLTEDFENLKAQKIIHIPYPVLLMMIVFSLVSLCFLEKPVTSLWKKSSQQNYVWYGEINDVIVEGMYFSKVSYFNGYETYIGHPYVWIQDDIYQRAYSCHMEMLADDLVMSIGEKSRFVIQKNNEDEHIFMGQKKGFQRLYYDMNDFEYQKLMEHNHNLSMRVLLYDEENKVIGSYVIPLSDATSRLTTYHYHDQSIDIQDFQVDEDILIHAPTITMSEDYGQYDFVISSSETLENEEWIHQDMIYGDAQKEKHSFIYDGRYTHLYLPQSQNYYLHIVQFDDEPHIMKTVRLEKQ